MYIGRNLKQKYLNLHKYQLIVLKGKKIIVGVSASIAAYKSILLVRLLKKVGAEVRVVMTSAAQDFVSPLVLSTLSEHPVWIDFHTNQQWNNHVELGLWADAMIIAPATCNTLSKMANGLCDNLLIATYLSARCPILIAPAMDEDMFKHPSNQENIQKLKSYQNKIIQPNVGYLASGLQGEGRLAEPEEIMETLIHEIGRSKDWEGKKVLITAGPTQELIDPVRYISNHSTGKMGIALAEAAYLKGAKVLIILGPTSLKPAFTNIEVVPVLSANEMLEKTDKAFENCDVLIASAAVADYRPQEIAKEKIKKNSIELEITLEKNPDILSYLSSKKRKQKLIGFALETQNEIFNAKEKLKAKNLDAIVLNSLQVKGAGFGTDTNQVSIFLSNGQSFELPLASKNKIASQLIQLISENLLTN